MTRLNQIETEDNACPVRDNIWVEMMNPITTSRAVRYEICRATRLTQHHIAYQPVGGHSLRHAGFRRFSFFYPYSVPTGQQPPSFLIEIEDNIPDDLKNKILQPFFTTKKGTQGTGLGLSITNDIIKAHGGSLDIKSGAKGSIFNIHIPK